MNNWPHVNMGSKHSSFVGHALNAFDALCSYTGYFPSCSYLFQNKPSALLKSCKVKYCVLKTDGGIFKIDLPLQ